VRVWGNHDDDWRRERIARRHLYGPFGSEVARWEAVRLTVTRGEDELGTLFLAHGHQGTADSQILAKVARPTVMIFGMLQRRFNRPWNTPATDSNLRERHDVAMYEWARRRAADGLVLIAGHTHRPVFWNTKPRQPSREQVAELEKTLEREREAGAAPEALGKMRAQAEYWRAQWLTGVKPPIDMEAPSYFNTGCCAFADGDVTGIEIADGQITLVRWPDNSGEPLPEQLVTPEPLAKVFDAVRAHGEKAGPD
jgi:predicted phosphodiesterase